MKGHNSAAVRTWVIVAAASIAIAAGTLASFPGSTNSKVEEALHLRQGHEADAGAARKALRSF